jgi:hypothetical protein
MALKAVCSTPPGRAAGLGAHDAKTTLKTIKTTKPVEKTFLFICSSYEILKILGDFAGASPPGDQRQNTYVNPEIIIAQTQLSNHSSLYKRVNIWIMA